ncbi:TonB-dependent receptor [Fulvivirga ulvae]|uniref:TonB-dependent receptor n=1 Tax=Fulvivirga ulvae TaxID=2904245 RepID=UPI001F2A8F48|nr:TonB-dependent receptor [Fulvivirga ulvae]UII32482.1 TonB-dependent receptor [Fulvivirga ulvae]
MLKLIKKILIMALGSIAVIVQAAEAHHAKVKSVREVYIDLHLRKATLKEAFAQMEDKTNFRFHYCDDDINEHLHLTKEYKNSSIASILQDLSKEARLKFRQINEDISVSKLRYRDRKEETVQVDVITKTISITVFDENQQPLPGVNVVVKGTATGGTTDLSGNLVLDIPDDATLVFSYIGYKTQEVAVGDNSTLTINMELDEAQLQEVVVVGSRNQNRTVLETPVPVDIIAVDEIIKDVPQLEVGQILNYVAPSFSSNRQTIADGTDHVDPASLRGLGVDHVLVLINGKRRHNSALVNVNGSVGRGSVGTDLNTIPAAAIKRIEVLRDGAAAQYGSDAIAGVINIVLKDKVDELYFSGTLGQTYEGDGENAQFNVNYGFKVGERGFINLTGQYQYRGRIDRAGEWDGTVFKTDWDGSSPGIYAENFQAGDFSPFDVGKKLTQQEADAINDANAFTNNLTPQQEEALINQNGGRRAFTMKVGQSEAINTAFTMNSSFEIDDDKEFYIFGGLNSRRGQATGFYRLPNQDRTLTTVYPNGFLPEINSEIFDGAITGGLRGQIGEWYVDFSNTFGTNSFTYHVTNSLNASRGNSTATTFNAGGFKFSQNTTNLDFNRYFPDQIEGINVAFGAEYRVDTYEIFAGEEASYRNYGNVNVIDTLADGSPFSNEFNQVNIFYNRPGGAQVFPGFQPENELKESRSNVALYSDIELNFTKDLFIDVAARYEDYSDFGNTFNWKVASRWSVTKPLAIRAAVSTGFRAPSLPQRYYNSTSTLFFLNAEGVNVPNEVGTFRNDSRIAELFGIPNLSNENSINVSAGITWQINDNLNFTLDGYGIRIEDRVVLTGSFSSSSSDEIAAILNEANAASATFFVNAIDTETKGLDMILTHRTPLAGGTLRSSLAANFTSTEVTDVNIPSSLQGAPDQFFNREERNRFEDALPQSKINLTLLYHIGKFNITLSNVRFGEVWVRTVNTDTNGDFIDQEFGAKIITDLSIGYNITDHINLTVGANNLFDIYPDENRAEFRSNERFVYSRRATQFGFNGGFYFARLNLTL